MPHLLIEKRTVYIAALVFAMATVVQAQPSNDECPSATSLALPFVQAGSTSSATFDSIPDCGTFIGAPGVWYQVVGTGAQLTASTCNAANYDTKLSVYCGECQPAYSSCCPGSSIPGCDDATCEAAVCAFDPFCCNVGWDSICEDEAAVACPDLCSNAQTCVGGNDDAIGCGLTSEFTWCSEVGVAYHILVHGFNNQTGDFTLSITEGAPCINTTGIACPATVGACCADGVCELNTADECALRGGVYDGDGTICDNFECERAHPGWNSVDVGISLTGHQPTYWSAATGQPQGVSPFTILDPGTPPGRPAMDGTTDRVLRGYIVAWAVDPNGVEIRWNHLKGDAVTVNYALGTAWEYTTYSFAVVNGSANGAPTGLTPGQLDLDGIEYDQGYETLLLDFYSSIVGGTFDTELTLLPVSVDLRQETEGPVATKASFTIWNQNEVKLTGMDRCITCWDSTFVSQYGVPNHFLLDNLQTSKGKAQIVGVPSKLCDFDYDPGDICTQNALAADPTASGADPTCDPRDILSQDASLLGVAMKQFQVNSNGYDTAGMNLVGMGYKAATIKADFAGSPPDERPGDIGGGRTPHVIARQAVGDDSLNAESQSQSGDSASAVLAANDRCSASEKGSLLIFPKVELRWNEAGDTLLQDTFIDLTNDYPDDVQVQMYFINGDAPLVIK